jgi:hypothetical protein
MYPELITRPDIKVFLPPIGNLTVYICEYTHLQSTLIHIHTILSFAVGNPAYMTDESKILTLRVHDECMPSSSTFALALC